MGTRTGEAVGVELPVETNGLPLASWSDQATGVGASSPPQILASCKKRKGASESLRKRKR